MLPILGILVALLAVYVVNFYRNVRKYPPGPPPLPFIGNIHMFKDPSAVSFQFLEFAKTYGNVFTLFMPRPWIIIMDYEAMKDAFVTMGEDFAGRTGLFPDVLFMSTPNGGVVFSEGDNWVQQRRTALHILRDFGMGRNVMEQKVKLSVQEFCNHIETLEDKSNVNLRWPLQLMVGNIINLILYGWDYKYDDFGKFRRFCEQFEKVFKEAVEEPLALAAISFPWVRSIPYIGYRAYDKFIDDYEVCHDIVKEDVDTCLKSFHADEEPECVVHAYNQKILQNVPFANEAQLYNIASDFFAAGMETTTTTLRWAVTYLAADQDIQDKVRNEILSVVGSERMVSMADRPNLPYYYATIHETLRASNIFPISIQHRTTRDTKIFNHQIPENTVVLAQMDAIHRTDPHFENPEEFNPERFLLEDGKTLNKEVMDRVVAFGLGKRQCAGESLARMELFIGLATIVQKYRIMPVDGGEFTLEPKKSAVRVPQQECFRLEII